MKSIKVKEAVCRTLSTFKTTLYGRLCRFLFILILLMISPHFVYTADISPAAPAKDDHPQSSWKEIKLVLDASHEYSWCGNRHIVFSGYGKDKGKGIRLYDLDSGAIQDITNDPKHRNVSCAADGQYIVFTDDIFNKNKNGSLFVYDKNTKTIKKMYEMESVLLNFINSMPLSPNANYLLGPDLPEVQKYILPGGKEVKLLPYRKDMGHRLQWSADERNFFLFDSKSGKLNIRDLKMNTDKNLYFRVKDFWLRNIHVTKDNKLYVDAMSGSDMGDNSITNLYLFDLKDPGKQGALLVSNILFYNADDEGNVVFEKESKKGHFIYYLERGKKQAQVLKEFAEIEKDIGMPKISINGKGIIFSIPTTTRGTRVYTIIIRN